MYLTGQWQLQMGLARALRVGFQHVNQYRWNPDQALSKVHIYDEFPLVGMRYPAVTVKVTGGDLLSGHRGIGEEIAEVETTPITIGGSSWAQMTTDIISGTNRLDASLNVFARSGYDRASVADWCALIIRTFCSDKLQREGLFIQDMRMGPQIEQLVGADPVYSVSLSISCVTAFTRQIPISTAQTLNAVCLTGIFTSIDGATYGDSA